MKERLKGREVVAGGVAELKGGMPMAERGRPEDITTLQELTVSNSFEIAALIAVLERKGILTQAEILDEIARQKKGRLRGR